jgi:hypothetical protein
MEFPNTPLPRLVARQTKTAMANGIDRVGKLFSRKRDASARPPSGMGVSRSSSLSAATTLVEPSIPPPSPPVIPPFPRPSFIRPTQARMVARDEKFECLKANIRANSVPEISPPQRPRHGSTQETTTPSHFRYSSRPSSRSSYLLVSPQRRDPALASLANFQFREASGNRQEVEEIAPTTRISRTLPPRLNLCLDGLQDLEPMFRLAGVETPPPSDQDEKLLLSGEASSSQSVSVLPPKDTHTPAASPPSTPVRDSHLLIPDFGSDLSWKPLLARDSIESRASRRRSSRVPAARSDKQSLSIDDPILKEPNFGEFLTLSDDDIAESRPSTPVPDDDATPRPKSRVPATPPPKPAASRIIRSSNPPSTPPSVQAPPVPTTPANHTPPVTPITMAPLTRQPSVSPCSSPLATPATVAAFQVARIAHTHNFDLVYVVNLWPKGMSFHHNRAPWDGESPPTTPTQSAQFGQAKPGVGGKMQDSGSLAKMSPHSPLHGRFLAAYGLMTVKPPFYLCGSTHSKLLNADRWMEFHNAEAKGDEWGSGYGCAFYTGQAPMTGSASTHEWDADTEGPDPGRSSTRAKRYNLDHYARRASTLRNRGIAFVAWRKAKTDGAKDSYTPDQLEALRRDAEALVDSILDSHASQRRREQLSALRASAAQHITDPLDSNARLSFPRSYL